MWIDLAVFLVNLHAHYKYIKRFKRAKLPQRDGSSEQLKKSGGAKSSSFTAFLLAFCAFFMLNFEALHHARTSISLGSNVTTDASASVGFHLAPSSGKIAVDFDNGTLWTYSVDGNSDYLKVMQKLHSTASMRRAPPYRDLHETLRDAPRMGLRHIRKRIGLPASEDVGVLSNVVRELCKHAEDRVAFKVIAAAMSIPHIPAIYQDDVHDILSYVGVEYLHYDNFREPVLYELSAAYNGYGLGSCEHYEDEELCGKEPGSLSTKRVLLVHVARNSWTLSFGEFRGPTIVREGGFGDYRYEAYGTDILFHPNEFARKQWWMYFVSQWIWAFDVKLPFFGFNTVLVLGDPDYVGKGTKISDFMDERLKRGLVKQSFDTFLDDSEFAAAKGTAELVKRGLPRPCFPPPSIESMFVKRASPPRCSPPLPDTDSLSGFYGF